MRADPLASMHLLLVIYPVVLSDEEPSWIETLLKGADIRLKVLKDMFSVAVRTRNLISRTRITKLTSKFLSFASSLNPEQYGRMDN
jgi:hypothetical protein